MDARKRAQNERKFAGWDEMPEGGRRYWFEVGADRERVEVMITREVVASRIRDYLQHRITRAALVAWAEDALMDGEFDDHDLDTIRDITSRLGLADVREFGLSWEDCEAYLSRLGYRAKVEVVQTSL